MILYSCAFVGIAVVVCSLVLIALDPSTAGPYFTAAGSLLSVVSIFLTTRAVRDAASAKEESAE